ncbi:MAG TPA: glycine cleavage system protein T, partial [Thiotrichales bacterium]|nr:glycine cleavage system protein T [Thiotrichales bacterium]
EAQRAAGVPRKLVGLVLLGKGVLRNHQKVITGAGEGEITSGGYSPTLERSIALARIPAASDADEVQVDIRGRLQPARVVRPPFVRQGEIKVDIGG